MESTNSRSRKSAWTIEAAIGLETQALTSSASIGELS